MSRTDPIWANYFEQVEYADKAGDLIFWLAALVSGAALFVDEKARPAIFSAIQVGLVVLAVLSFGLGLATRFYLLVRAEDARRKDFMGHAFGSGVLHERTDGYYNSTSKDPLKRMAAQVMENSFFTKEIVRYMLHRTRILSAGYVVIWLALVLWRRSEFTFILAVTQVVFSEQLLSKWLRQEWLRGRCEHVYEALCRFFQAQHEPREFSATAMEFLSQYETSKANAGILLDSRIFESHNSRLSQEWENIKGGLKIDE